MSFFNNNKKITIKEYSFINSNIQKKIKPNIEKRSLTRDNYLKKCNNNHYHRNYPDNKYNKSEINERENEIIEFLAEMQYERQKNEYSNPNGDSDSDQTITGEYVN